MSRYRFDRFELDADTGDLRCGDGPVKLQPQPLKVLTCLVEHAGRLVTRDELQAAIWGDDTFVDFQRGLNFCVAQIRSALGDDATAPRFIQTVPRRGYRFIAPVAVDAAGAWDGAFSLASSRRSTGRGAAAALVGMAALTATLLLVAFRPPSSSVAGEVRLSRDAAANDAFVKGQYLVRKGTRGDLRRALGQFRAAAARDTTFAAAEAAVAETSVRLVLSGRAAPRELFPSAQAAAARAARLDATLPDAHAALGATMLWYDGDAAGAARELERALVLDPRHAVARHDYGWALIALHRFDEGLREIREAQRLDPLSPRATIDVGWALLRTGRYAAAVAQSRRALDLEPDFAEAQACLEAALRLSGQLADGVAVARAAWHGPAALPVLDADPAIALSQIAELRLARLTASRDGSAPSSAPVSAYQIAAQLNALGRKDEALVWLERAYEERSPMMALLPLDPAFGPAFGNGNLRDEPRFIALVRRLPGSASGG
jgi:DNA-binding winged helix-turn-helix (wHTH) protein/Flp pilus assembly protein TadD